MPKNTIPNPYPPADGVEMRRMNVDVYATDYDFVRRIRVEKGTITAVINTLFYKLCHELRSRGILDYTSEDAFVDFINNCVLVSGTAPLRSPVQDDVSNDRGGTPSVRPATQSVEEQRSNLQGRVGGRKGNGKGQATRQP